MYKLDLEKAEEPEIKLPTSAGLSKKQESSKKVNAKECLNYCTIALTSHASNVMLKILQARLQQYVNHDL